MNRVVTFEEAQRVLEACVAERGEDYCYPAQARVNNICQYWWGDGEYPGLPEGPGCLIGLALSKLGVWDHYLREMKSINSNTLLANLERAGWTFEPGVATLFREAQMAQDGGHTWATALEYAKNPVMRLT